MNFPHTNFSNLRPSLLTLFLIAFSVLTHAQLTNIKALSNTMEIKLPLGFKFMDANVLATKYPQSNNLSEVYTNEAATVNIALKKVEQLLVEQKVYVEGKKLEQQLMGSGKVKMIGSEQIKANGNNIHVFSFYSNAIDTKVYNVMFVFSLKGRMVVGSFNCTNTMQSKWQVIAYEIIRSIKEV